MYLKFLRPFGSLIGLAGIAASIGFGFANASSQNARPPPQQNSQNGLKVAVIGTGIGGSSAAYFIHKSLGEDTTIDVFEKADKVGGRMAVVEMDGEAFEAGASIVHDSNKYIKEFCDMGGKQLTNYFLLQTVLFDLCFEFNPLVLIARLLPFIT